MATNKNLIPYSKFIEKYKKKYGKYPRNMPKLHCEEGLCGCFLCVLEEILTELDDLDV